MNELEEKLNALLSNPQLMQQIASMAQSMGAEPQNKPVEPVPPPAVSMPSFDPKLLQTLAQTRVLINQAYSGFNTAHDPELIESFVFEINALQCRYSYLLRRIKELEGSA